MIRKTMMVALPVLLVLLGPAGATAQAPEQRIEAARQRAQQSGIPVALLESKVAEGRAKGVPMERIAAAVEARYTALERARNAFGPRGGASVAELSLGADAVHAGVSEAVLAALAARAEGEQRAVAISALTQLVQMGHAPEHALARVTEALGRGTAAVANLPAQERAQARRGDQPGAQGKGRPDHAGPPAAVPAPGKPPQSGKPNPPRGRPGG